MVEKLADIAAVQWNVKITACIRKLQHLCIFHLPPILSNSLPRLSGDFTQTVLFCLYPLKSAHLHLVQSEAENKGVALCAQFDAALPVWGDAVRLQQILQNLVTNAIHYTPSGGTITVHSWEAEGSALVCVQDTGCGIAPEDQAAVFDRYFHTTANTKHDSTGLGLTIAQELARLHHGEILLESEVGKGSCFTLKLPLLAD